jgi:hypothetical protein
MKVLVMDTFGYITTLNLASNLEPLRKELQSFSDGKLVYYFDQNGCYVGFSRAGEPLQIKVNE